jgi:serine/threonine protein kinase
MAVCWPATHFEYQLRACIGASESGTSSVRVATCQLAGGDQQAEVAVKVVDLEKRSLVQLQQEVMRMSQLSNRNLAPLHAAFVSRGELWLVMQYHAAGSCCDVMRYAHRHGLEEDVVLTILREVAFGLDYLHRTGTIHRHLKSSNILIDAKV